MPSFFKPMTFNWWQIGIFKLCLFSLGAIVGMIWPEILTPYITTFIAVAIATALYLLSLWWRQVND